MNSKFGDISKILQGGAAGTFGPGAQIKIRDFASATGIRAYSSANPTLTGRESGSTSTTRTNGSSTEKEFDKSVENGDGELPTDIGSTDGESIIDALVAKLAESDPTFIARTKLKTQFAVLGEEAEQRFNALKSTALAVQRGDATDEDLQTAIVDYNETLGKIGSELDDEQIQVGTSAAEILGFETSNNSAPGASFAGAREKIDTLIQIADRNIESRLGELKQIATDSLSKKIQPENNQQNGQPEISGLGANVGIGGQLSGALGVNLNSLLQRNKAFGNNQQIESLAQLPDLLKKV